MGPPTNAYQYTEAFKIKKNFLCVCLLKDFTKRQTENLSNQKKLKLFHPPATHPEEKHPWACVQLLGPAGALLRRAARRVWAQFINKCCPEPGNQVSKREPAETFPVQGHCLLSSEGTWAQEAELLGTAGHAHIPGRPSPWPDTRGPGKERNPVQGCPGWRACVWPRVWAVSCLQGLQHRRAWVPRKA